MASTHLYRAFSISAQVALTTTGDKFTFSPAVPVNIVRWGVIADALIDVGAGMVIALDHRVTFGSDTGRVNGATSAGKDTAGGTLSTGTTDVAQGKGLYREVNQVPGPFKLAPGEQAVFEVTDAADTAGTGFLWLEYEVEGFAGTGETTVAAGNRLANMTKKTS